MSTMNLTPAVEDYLEVILELSEENAQVRVTDIAKKLNIAKASVTEKIKALQDKELVISEKYGPITLTTKGEREALKVRYIHEILLNFISEVLKVDFVTAEKDACKIEHSISTETILALLNYLEKNNYLNNYLDVVEVKLLLRTKPLCDLKPGKMGVVKKIAAQGKLKRKILEMGIISGDKVEVKGVAPMGDPIEVVVKDYKLSLRKNEAASIWVEVI